MQSETKRLLFNVVSMSQQPTVHLKGSSRALLTHRPIPLYVHAQNRAGGE